MQQAISRCTISIAVEIVLTPQTQLCNRCPKMPLARLEPCGSKDPCTVLRGLGAGNRAWLPDSVPKENRAGNDRPQGTAVVARRRNRSEEIYKAAAQRLVTPAT